MQPPQENISREITHGGMIARHLSERKEKLPGQPVLVETGCGISTVSLAEAGRNLNATIYSCDYNREKVNALQQRAGSKIDNVTFLIGDSLDSLRKICAQHTKLDFVFLDAAASAMHTFREFQLIEAFLKPGSSLLIDNAALPDERWLLSPCRKGKIIVPYLMASTNWEVRGHPTAGDSMISAIHHDTPDYADPSCEWSGFVDTWKQDFESYL